MAFCSQCGSAVEGKFCSRCGAAVEATSATNSPAAVPPPAQAAMDENLASALCYLLGIITGALFLILEPYNRNRNIRFHAFQSIFLHIAAIAAYIGIAIVTGIFRFIPFLGEIFAAILFPVIGLGLFALWVTLMYKTYKRERLVLPVIGEFAEKQV